MSKNFNFFLSKALQSINSEKRESIIMGDVNVNYLIENDREVIKDIFTDNGFKQILNTPTRVRSILDAVLKQGVLRLFQRDLVRLGLPLL